MDKNKHIMFTLPSLLKDPDGCPQGLSLKILQEKKKKKHPQEEFGDMHF